jgi:hypothetical protein
MLGNLRFLLACVLAYLSPPAVAGTHPSMAEVLAAAQPADWRPLDPNNTLYVELPAGRIDLCNVPIAVGEPAPPAPQSP